MSVDASGKKGGGMDELFLARQPILDGEGRIAAFELLFRASDMELAEVSDDTLASAHVIASAFGTLGLGLAQGNCRYYVNVGRELLLSDAVELLPAGSVTLELLESISADGAVVDRCRQLAAKGYELALDDFVYHEDHEPLLDLARVVKVDVTLQGLDEAEDLARRIRAARPGKDMVFLAEKVERREEFERLRRGGFGLFQGYFFARPHQLSARRVDPSAVAMLKALEIVIRDGETEAIEDAIKNDPMLCCNLLRLANSVALGAGRAVNSLRQAVVLLGRQQIRRWLQLLIFARRGGGSGGALLHLAAARGKLMELLAGGGVEERDKAFTTGILSLVDVLLDLPMEEIAAQLGLGGEIRQALLERKGELGELLRLCEALEADDASLRAVPPQGKADGAAVMKAQLEALSWASGLTAAVH
jgi:EAL and modified HD-GYP domain-containing signal transduction protein